MAPKGRSDRRVEPSFEGQRRQKDEFRLDADERIVGSGRPSGKSAKRGREIDTDWDEDLDDEDDRDERPARRERRQPPRERASRDKVPRGKTPRRRQGGGFFGAIRRLVYWCIVLGIWAGIGAGGLVAYYASKMPSASSWTIPARPPNMKITASDGSVLANRGTTGGEALALEEMSPYLPQAVVAIEDRRFYSHFGVDPMGLARAFVNNLTGQPIQGGSTITQQLAKNLFLSPDRTFERKIQEVMLAFWLEQKFTKDQILAMYLNRVFFGSGAYGVEAASRRYFNKSARDVNLGEAAMIAGLLKAPSKLSPARDPQAAEARAQVVLGTMREQGFINDSDLKTAMAQPPAKAKSYWTGAQHYAADMVVEEVKGLVGEPKLDLTVETTIDLKLETAADKALNDILKKDGGKSNASQAALVSVDATGAIRAVVGGRDYATSQFNRAFKAKRQPGSAFKPFVYASALEAGARPDTVMNDGPVKIGNWSPENFDQKYRGPVTIASAFAQSLNTIAAQLVVQVGPDKVVSLAHRLGVDSDIQNNASIALGTSEVSLVELTSAYAAFMNGGYKATPHIVKRITDAEGKVLYDADYSNPPRVLSEPVAATMNSMMNRVINEGTGKAAKIDGWQAAGKSGTTQSFRDALFVGYTSIMTTGIWFGNDDGTYMKKVTGGGLPARAWHDYMTVAMKGYSPTPLFGTGRGLDLPPAAPQEQSPQTTIGDIISGVFSGSGRQVQDQASTEYPPAPAPPGQNSAAAQPVPASLPASQAMPQMAPAARQPQYPQQPLPPQAQPQPRNRTAAGNGQVYDAPPPADYRRTYGGAAPPADVGNGPRDYRQYRGSYDSSAPLPPGNVGGGPVPPGDVGMADGVPGDFSGDMQPPGRQARRTTLFDVIMGQ